jgi:hypothetical protein
MIRDIEVYLSDLELVIISMKGMVNEAIDLNKNEEVREKLNEILSLANDITTR